LPRVDFAGRGAGPSRSRLDGESVLIFPARHHSPAAALQIDRLIRTRRPRAVLIEGPADADALIPFLLDRATTPPVAIYAYRADAGTERERARSVFYPLCHYSPEYAALKAGRAVGATLRFCDLPARTTLSWPDGEDDAAPGESADDEGDPPAHRADGGPVVGAPGYTAFTTRLATVAGFDSFDAFWEAAFEQACGGSPVEDYLAAFAEYGARARDFLDSPRDEERDRLRERHMAGVAAEVVAGGVPTEGIVLVCGAAHAAGIASLMLEDPAKPALPEAPAVELALVPYSYPRLSEQRGYGAGNRAPWFYQQVWHLDGDYATASRRALVTVAQGLRRRGQVASLAQEIDADELATVLAGMRGKQAAGVDEVIDAAVACFGQGNPRLVEEAVREVLTGDELGRVTPRAGRTPLQTEFYGTAQRLKLPVVDAPRQILVHLPVPDEAAQSVFLHRLVTADVPFARELQSGIGAGGRAAQGGPLAGLGRAREKWELCWSPATDASLVERNAWGSTLAEVCARLLRARLDAATRVDEGTTILLRLALCDLLEPFPAALARCEDLAADSGSFPALARAAFHLDGLLAYGAARRLPQDQLADLAGRLFVRAALHLPAAVICADEAAAEIEQTVTPLAELVRRKRPCAAPDVFWEAVESVAAMESTHPGLRGLALTLLELQGRLEPGELARRLRPWLAAGDAAANARLVAGVFSLQRSALVRNRGLIAAVSDFLLDLGVDALIPLLPALRRTLGDLSPSERSYLGETLGAVFGLDAAPRVSLNLSELERALLADADAAAAATLVEWKERYGIA
jgi:Family of unknown function (DUF5682)